MKHWFALQIGGSLKCGRLCCFLTVPNAAQAGNRHPVGALPRLEPQGPVLSYLPAHIRASPGSAL